MEVRAAEIAELLAGRLVGDADIVVTGISSLAEAEDGDISFLANPRYAPMLEETRAAVVLVAEAVGGARVTQLVVNNPDFAFAKVVQTYGPQPRPIPVGVHPTAMVGEGVVIGEGAAIGAYAVVGEGTTVGAGSRLFPHSFVGDDCRLGAGCVLYPHVTVREGCILGDRVVVHSGAVIGSDGFGYATVEGVHHKIPQVGTVVVGDDVEIGANTTIDRARFGTTTIGAGSKIDNLVQVAHNVEIGEHSIIVAQVGIAGSTKLGRHVTMAGQSGASGHLTIGDGAVVAARAGVTKNLPPRAVVAGLPAQNVKQHQLQEVAARRLPRLQGLVKELERRVAELEGRLGAADGGAAG